MSEANPPTKKTVKVEIFDLNDNTHLTEIERIKSNPGKYQIVVEETIVLPFRHMEYEILPPR